MASQGTAFQEVAVRVALTYGLLWFALVLAGAIRRFDLIGDYSYGIYIICFPIQQTLVMLDPQITPSWLLLCSFPAVLAFAILSWHFIEHPALRQKSWARDCVGSMVLGVRQRLAAAWGAGLVPKAEALTGR